MAANRMINVRCSDDVIELVDTVGAAFGMTRAEILRTGGIRYCQELLMTDSLKQLLSACYEVAQKANKADVNEDDLKALETLVDVLQKNTGLA